MLIGLTGYAGAGKDTAADYLVKNHGFERVAFADKLKALVYEQNPDVAGQPLRVAVDSEGWDAAKRSYPAVRELLQRTGQAHREVFGEDFWIDQVLPKTKPRFPAVVFGELGGRPGGTVVTDVRYANEAARIRALGGIVVRIERPGVGPANDHVTEQPLEADTVVRNIEGHVDTLYTALEYIIRIENGELPTWRAF